MDREAMLGSCHCGSVKYRVTGKVEAFFCHCNSCRLNSGAPFTAWGRVKSKNFKLESGTLKEFDSSIKAKWSFCHNCGTGISYKNIDTSSDIDFLLATLNSPSKVTPKYHIQTKEKLSWITISDGLPEFERWVEEQS